MSPNMVNMNRVVNELTASYGEEHYFENLCSEVPRMSEYITGYEKE